MLKEKMLESDGDNSLIEEFTTISVSIDADTREVSDSHVHQDMYTEREDMYTEREDMNTERKDMYTETLQTKNNYPLTPHPVRELRFV